MGCSSRACREKAADPDPDPPAGGEGEGEGCDRIRRLVLCFEMMERLFLEGNIPLFGKSLKITRIRKSPQSGNGHLRW